MIPASDGPALRPPINHCQHSQSGRSPAGAAE